MPTLTRFISLFHGIMGAVFVVDVALSLLTLMMSEAAYTYMAFFFLFLLFLSVWSLYALFKLRKTKEEKAVPIIVLPTLASNGGWYVLEMT